jgi:hypothetical protein
MQQMLWVHSQYNVYIHADFLVHKLVSNAIFEHISACFYLFAPGPKSRPDMQHL